MSRIFLYITSIRGLELCVTSHMAIALFKTWRRPCPERSNSWPPMRFPISRKQSEMLFT